MGPLSQGRFDAATVSAALRAVTLSCRSRAGGNPASWVGIALRNLGPGLRRGDGVCTQRAQRLIRHRRSSLTSVMRKCCVERRHHLALLFPRRREPSVVLWSSRRATWAPAFAGATASVRSTHSGRSDTDGSLLSRGRHVGDAQVLRGTPTLPCSVVPAQAGTQRCGCSSRCATRTRPAGATGLRATHALAGGHRWVTASTGTTRRRCALAAMPRASITQPPGTHRAAALEQRQRAGAAGAVAFHADQDVGHHRVVVAT